MLCRSGDVSQQFAHPRPRGRMSSHAIPTASFYMDKWDNAGSKNLPATMRIWVMSQRWNVVAWAAAALLLGGCAAPLPDSGFQRSDLTSTDNQTQLQGVQFVEVTAPVVRQLNAHQATQLFSDIFGDAPVGGPPIGPGDILQVTIWEAPPAS